MEKKYLNESRYKKGSTRKRRNSKTVRSNVKDEKALNSRTKQKKATAKKTQAKLKTNKKKNGEENKVLNIIICIVLLIMIGVISRAILKDENEPFIHFPFMTKANDEVVKIGVITSDSLLDKNTTNLVINELNKYSKDMLIEVNEDYSITYKCISNIQKKSNSEYILTINSKSKVKTSYIKETLEQHIKNEESLYYFKLKNVSSISIIDNESINIKLKQPDEYFIYNLDICLNTSNDLTNYVQDLSSTKERLVLNRHEDADEQLPEKVIVTKYKDMYAAADAYKKQEINMFVTDAENVQNILGKYDYNIKAYRNGKSMFLFGNPKSDLYSRIEVRKAIAYGIDRDGIIQEILKSKGEKIDLPYIYDNTKYKYDVYAAENLLLTNQYTKSNKVYSKKENGKKIILGLDLIVNKNDEIKINVANKIKNNLNAIGIKINIIKLTEAKLAERIEKGKYDLCLANVNLNNVPNVSFVEQNLYITEDINAMKNNINVSNVEDLSKNIYNLQQALSNQISVIGIYSDISYVVYSQEVIGIDKVGYMNIFKSIFT